SDQAAHGFEARYLFDFTSSIVPLLVTAISEKTKSGDGAGMATPLKLNAYELMTPSTDLLLVWMLWTIGPVGVFVVKRKCWLLCVTGPLPVIVMFMTTVPTGVSLKSASATVP